MSQIELGERQNSNNLASSANPVVLANATLPRGGRNPFKNMGAKIVDRVRRSLSRTRKPSEEPREKEKEDQELMLPPMPTSPPPPMPASYSSDQNSSAEQKRGVEPTPVKTKKIVIKKKPTKS
uniref:Uncharacterized protein n=2 Tax=Panagrolaimus sp. JU765 TaxID=591449 RepID=A0AC34QPV2_9BILA